MIGVDVQWNTLMSGRNASFEMVPWCCCEAWFNGWFRMRGSSVDNSGMVKNFSLEIIFWLISLLNSCTCFLMYRRKALLDQRPISIIVYTGTPARYIAIAAPLLVEWRPIQSAENPNVSFPIAVVAHRSCCRSMRPVMRHFFPSLKYVFTWVSLFVFG